MDLFVRARSRNPTLTNLLIFDAIMIPKLVVCGDLNYSTGTE